MISGLGLLLALVEIWHAFEMETTLGVMLEAVLPLLLAIALIYAGYWLSCSGLDSTGIGRILGWFTAGTIGMLLVTAWVISHQLIRGLPFPHAMFVAMNTVTVGGIGGFLIGVYDVRSRRRAERLARERRNVARERERIAFLNHLLRHNVLNEMNVALGRIDSVRPHVQPDGQKHLETIRICGEDIVTLVQKVKTFTRIVSDGCDTALRTVDLSRTLERELEKLRLSFGEVTVVADVPPDVHVIADDLLSEVFENILLNAVQHNDAAKPVVRISVDDAADRVRVTIADNGPGFPEQLKERVFVVEGANTYAASHGVGLKIANALIERYRGVIRVEDNKPTGTRVHIEFIKPTSVGEIDSRAKPHLAWAATRRSTKGDRDAV
ncbi:ATP-binding protein [Halegenticoccus soli]|uniref:ATP-binding protein n=1 Tax=Halegenticoccus soli TaxID=1985678 RepID=UPI001E2BE0B6|nr:ATP-binding protein [Halegenticoccus soli]